MMSFFLDHLVIRVDNLEEESEAFSELFGLQPHLPPQDYVYFSNAVFRFGNADIELFRCGEKDRFTPYLYGLCLGSHLDIWQLVNEMSVKGIRHTLPMRTELKTGDENWIWYNMLLDGFLDNPSPAVYGNAKASRVNKAIAQSFDWLLAPPKVKKALVKDIGDSMVFFTQYESDVAAIRQKANELFHAANGGRFGVSSISKVLIETCDYKDNWEALLADGLESGPGIEVSIGKRNVLSTVELAVSSDPAESEIEFGSVQFSLTNQ